MLQQQSIDTSAHHSTETFTDAAHQLEESAKRRLVLLHHRAIALAASANFKAAFEDTAAIRTLAPSSGIGYLCTGHVHQLQGRYGACIDICDQGLAVVSSPSNPHYQQLLNMRSLAVKKYNTCVDFMKYVPGEIINIIVDKLLGDKGTTLDHLGQYLSISKLWRDKILRYTHNLHLISNPTMDLIDKPYILKHASPYATSLTTKYEATGAYKIFQQYQFPSLRFLDLDEVYPDDTDPAMVLTCLASVQSTVTYLDIRMENLDYALGDILSTFPQLVSLRCDDIDVDITNAPDNWPMLKELMIRNEREGISSEHLNKITQRLPELEIFSVNPCVDTYALSMIQDNCPKLKLISYNDYRNEELYMERITYEGVDKSAGNIDNDMQSLNINYIEDDAFQVDILDIITFITRNSHSLQSIYFCYNSNVDVITYYPIYEHVILSHLTSYIHKISYDENVHLALCVIERSPHLQVIELLKGPRLVEDNDYYDDDHDVYRRPPHIYHDLGQIFIAMTGLADLQVANIQIKGGDAAAGIHHFLQYHNSIDSKLRTLFVPKHTELSLDTLGLLAGLSRLEDLTLRLQITGTQDWANDGRQFLEKLAKGCPLLHRLSLYDTHGLHLLPMKHFSNLELLCLKLDVIDYIELLPLMECPNLERLVVDVREQTEDIDDELGTLLRTKMVVTVYGRNM